MDGLRRNSEVVKETVPEVPKFLPGGHRIMSAKPILKHPNHQITSRITSRAIRSQIVEYQDLRHYLHIDHYHARPVLEVGLLRRSDDTHDTAKTTIFPIVHPQIKGNEWGHVLYHPFR